MDIQFVAQIDASADVVAFPVRKGEAGALGALLGAAAAQARLTAERFAPLAEARITLAELADATGSQDVQALIEFIDSAERPLLR